MNSPGFFMHENVFEGRGSSKTVTVVAELITKFIHFEGESVSVMTGFLPTFPAYRV